MALIFHRLVGLEEARRLAEERLNSISGSENLEAVEAQGRVLDRDIFSGIDSPPFDRSEVDGYAVMSRDVEGSDQENPVTLRIAGSASIGEPALEMHEPGTCIRIATGAVIPIGGDSVVMVEYTRQNGNKLDVFRSVSPGENISQAGSDLSRGELILRAGTTIGSREIAVLHSVGIHSVSVKRKMRIAIISTGNELVEPGNELLPGRLFESNGAAVQAVLRQYSVFDATYYGIVKDDRNAIRKTIKSVSEGNDVIVTSGSTSAGEGDMVYDVLAEFQPGIVFHGVEVKPGKPTLLSMIGKVPVIGLPGFPVSALMVFDTIFLPALLRACGSRIRIKQLYSTVPVRVHLAQGKTNLVPVSLIQRETAVAYPLLGDSGSVSRIMRSDGYISIYGNRAYLEAGERVPVSLYSDDVQVPDLTFIGSHDIALEAIFREISLNVKVINVGSTGGIEAIRREEADLAGVHILNPSTMKYNDFSGDTELMEKAEIVKGYTRDQGILVKPGNPQKIGSIADIASKGIRFVNRNPGSGTRILIDSMLASSGIAGESIPGFSYEVKTHYAVANAIWSGRADAGIAIRQAAVMYGLDFIPVGKEEYDFLILRNSRKRLSTFIETLESDWFSELLKRDFSGYSR
ncbi:MAG: molybdopterin biosynthesis protein [Candidatus Thermoplasmatota archaeon]|nr:molybdopterin biosynthesis protein [Candidatus Thermoplasmatota archaeon]